MQVIEAKLSPATLTTLATPRPAGEALRLELVSVMCCGVAHRLNNVLSVISSYAEFLEDAAPDEQSRKDARAISQAAAEGSHLTTRLVRFGRGETEQTTDLGALVRSAEVLISSTLRPDIELQVATSPTGQCVGADPRTIEIMLMLLFARMNSRLPEGGRVRLETGTVPCLGRDAGHQARLMLREIPAESDGRVVGFRSADLAAVKAMARDMGGHVEVRDEVERTIEILLPAEPPRS